MSRAGTIIAVLVAIGSWGAAPARAVPRAKVRPPAARAKAPVRARASTAPAPQRMIFGDEHVTSGRQLPDGTVVQPLRRTRHSSLIVVRTSFRPELIASANQL